VPANLTGEFTAALKYNAAPFSVTIQKATFTVK